MRTTFGTILTGAMMILALLPGTAAAGEYVLRLGEFAFDPAEGPPVLPTHWDRSAPTQHDLRLVQLHGPTQAEALDAIKGRGLEVVQYIHPYTYIVWGSVSELQAAAPLPAVRATTDFAPAFRVQPQWRDLGRTSQSIHVLMVRMADVDEVIGAVERLGGTLTHRRALNGTFETTGFRIAGDRIREVANIPGVYSIRPEPTDGGLRTEMADQVCAGNVDAGNIAFPGYLDWLASIGLDGAGVVMANVDGGIQDSHPDLVNRLLPCSGDTCGGSDSSSHGTHTAGIMAGDGSSGTLDGFGFLRGLGVAPGANMIEQKYSPWHTQPGGMFYLMNQSWLNGALCSGNSWGPAGTPQGYDDATLEVDIGARDADPDAPGNQSFTYVLSIMNGYGGTSSQGTPDEAKNIFTIGSTKMQTGGGAQIPEIDDLSSNSAHGPCLDGRKIPHMVAPGCDVDSTDTGSSYSLKCGTSMASPHVTGAVGLFVEYYRGLLEYTEDPSPAMVKAAFLAVGRDLAGHEDADGNIMGHPFDNKQGWGRMDLPAILTPMENGARYWDNPVTFDNTGEEWVTTVSPLDPGQPMRMMLVWTDAPGHGLGGSTPAWNNDLDLVVEAGSNSYFGNNFGGDGYSVPGGVRDIKNNTEGVFFETVPGGAATIHVVASNINSDGVPGSGDDTDQDFSLACYNCAVEPGFTLTVEPPSREICAPDDTDSAVEVGEILGFSDPVTLSVTGVPAGAVSGFSVNPVTPPGSSTLTITNTGAAAAAEYALGIEGVSGDIERFANVGLRIDTSIPGQASLAAPFDGATDVPVTPTLLWDPVPQTVLYDLEVASDPGFADVVYSASEPLTHHLVTDPLDTLTTYYWRVLARNTCGEGAYSEVFSFTTMDFPPVLLVDDDDNSPDVLTEHTSTLDALGVPYDLWDTGNSDDEPALADLAPYQAVVWFTGDEFGGSAGPGGPGEAALASWLDLGRCLLIASQDYHYDRGLTSFMQDYLGVDNVVNDENQSTVTGQGTFFSGLGPYNLSLPYSNYTDIANPDGTAEVAFDGDVGTIAVAKASGIYVTTFWTFGLETLPTPQDRADVLSRFLQVCTEMPAPDSDQDGMPDDEDCAPADPDNWAMPGAASGLTVKKVSLGNLSWTPPAEPGSNAVTYDVLRSLSRSDFSQATCAVNGSTMTFGTDFGSPAPGDLYHYLVRVNNGCGDTLGTDSDDQPRPSGASCN